MSVTSIDNKNKFMLWAISGGRCQYRGCNQVLHTDILTKRNFNQSYIAHIVADVEGGPRGCAIRSPLLADDITNLMLLCDTHHRLIDRDDVIGNPESLLLEMKAEHENRIANACNISADKQSHIVTLNANIGAHTPNVQYSIISQSLLPDYYPAAAINIDLGTVNTLNKDSDPNFWNFELGNLQRRFDRLLFPLLNDGDIKHISLFCFAPIPLLIKLGVLLNDITSVDVRQKRRNPDTWKFDANIETVYNFSVASDVKSQVALKVELSDNIVDERITKVLGNDVSIYSISIHHPDNDFVKSRKQIIDFGEKMKEVFREIKKIHGQDAVLNIFPAMPVSLAVQLGRVWMPKADLSMRVFDQNYVLGGFSEALNIEHA
ncbi:SAVED domain-containing protein [Chryseobacterium arthrosphaerae]|uniref:SAVED domain-containing protein n=1 Tax=Chryseobacterium arthrosphaerae TaxID=651561 RepID=UPI001F4A8E58|nr:SAVED domain-containing protein [Chryseobacterium arthrosphaerae]